MRLLGLLGVDLVIEVEPDRHEDGSIADTPQPLCSAVSEAEQFRIGAVSHLGEPVLSGLAQGGNRLGVMLRSSGLTACHGPLDLGPGLLTQLAEKAEQFLQVLGADVPCPPTPNICADVGIEQIGVPLEALVGRFSRRLSGMFLPRLKGTDGRPWRDLLSRPDRPSRTFAFATTVQELARPPKKSCMVSFFTSAFELCPSGVLARASSHGRSVWVRSANACPVDLP